MIIRKHCVPAAEPQRYTLHKIRLMVLGLVFACSVTSAEQFELMTGEEFIARSGEMVLRYCTQPKKDALVCLAQEGFTCDLVEATGEKIYTCTGELINDMTTEADSLETKGPKKYEIRVKLFNSRSGWGGEVISVERLRN